MSAIDTTCTICSGIMICPRFYENCGHTICEECMVKMFVLKKGEKIGKRCLFSYLN